MLFDLFLFVLVVALDVGLLGVYDFLFLSHGFDGLIQLRLKLLDFVLFRIQRTQHETGLVLERGPEHQILGLFEGENSVFFVGVQGLNFELCDFLDLRCFFELFEAYFFSLLNGGLEVGGHLRSNYHFLR